MNDIFEDLFLQQDKKQDKSISVVICSMNRNENLQKSIQSCLNHQDINEIIVLDYGSKEPVKIQSNSQKIKLFRLEASYWHLSKAYNIAIQLAQSDIIIKLDADYILLDSFFDHHTIKENEYVSGFGQYDALCGFLMIYKSDFIKINGYNERIIEYGYDDDDINQRLQKHKLINKKLNRKLIKHSPHDKNPHIWFKNNLHPTLSRAECIAINRKISISNPWTTKDKMSKYTTISAFVCCMNRVENLQKSVESWLNTKYFDEIIVLDYGSNTPIIDIWKNEIVKIYRESAKFWHLTRAYNIATQLTTGNVLVKLDSDYCIKENFFKTNILNTNEFLTGNGCRIQSLWGFLMLYRQHFFEVNGYNERIIGWGHDDVDINNRLQKLGLKKKTIDIKDIRHLPHQSNKNFYCSKNEDINKTRKQNIKIINDLPWTNKDIMSKLNQY
jgi:glycosyltransferase involved in cell wall biosynthesis